MRLQLKRITLILLAFYVLITIYSCYRLLQRYVFDKRLHRSSPEAELVAANYYGPPPTTSSSSEQKKHQYKDEASHFTTRNNSGVGSPAQRRIVDIWGKAAIGLYLWEHVLSDRLQTQPGGAWSYGEMVIDSILFRFHTGPGVVPDTVSPDVRHLVLVLNGREQTKVDFALVWLRSLPLLRNLDNAAMVLLGNECCDNSWMRPYMRTNGGLLDLVYLVYDSADVDGRTVYQWPLGVATYRDFPNILPESLALERVRPFTCNFFGTVYANSSREALLRIIYLHKLKCLVRSRTTWQSRESPATLKAYTNALINSDLTLCPVGKNAESYRIYEAMVFGSVPVLEDRVTPGQCDATAFRLLKQLRAPVLYVKDWAELPALITREAKLSAAEIVARRQRVVQWYRDFKANMKRRFVDGIKDSFFNKKI